MALAAAKLARFCMRAEVTFIETGKQGEVAGYWFLSYRGKRIFFSEEEIHTRLERRKLTLFAPTSSTNGGPSANAIPGTAAAAPEESGA